MMSDSELEARREASRQRDSDREREYRRIAAEENRAADAIHGQVEALRRTLETLSGTTAQTNRIQEQVDELTLRERMARSRAGDFEREADNIVTSWMSADRMRRWLASQRQASQSNRSRRRRNNTGR